MMNVMDTAVIVVDVKNNINGVDIVKYQLLFLFWLTIIQIRGRIMPKIAEMLLEDP